jgi:hypothetical protein
MSVAMAATASTSSYVCTSELLAAWIVKFGVMEVILLLEQYAGAIPNLVRCASSIDELTKMRS